MRWLFLLLVVLNVFYYVWHQQEAPLKAKDVTPLALYRGTQQDIRLLSESGGGVKRPAGSSGIAGWAAPNCMYIGGVVNEARLAPLETRLAALGVRGLREHFEGGENQGYWLRVHPESRDLLGTLDLEDLSKEFNELKHKIMPCEGIASDE